MGSRLGEKGYGLLHQAHHLFQKVQVRIDAEPQQSRHWSLLQMAVLNNQTCIYHELALMEARDKCLDRLGMTLSDSEVAKAKYWNTFYFNFVILTGHTSFAPAA
jgi:hypothetical protein